MGKVKPVFDYVWFWKSSKCRPLDRRGTRCRILSRGERESVLVEFESDGLQVTTSRNAIRKWEPEELKK